MGDSPEESVRNHGDDDDRENNGSELDDSDGLDPDDDFRGAGSDSDDNPDGVDPDSRGSDEEDSNEDNRDDGEGRIVDELERW